jgi:hypothetical protein
MSPSSDCFSKCNFCAKSFESIFPGQNSCLAERGAPHICLEIIVNREALCALVFAKEIHNPELSECHRRFLSSDNLNSL